MTCQVTIYAQTGRRRSRLVPHACGRLRAPGARLCPTHEADRIRLSSPTTRSA